jgi:hypothetical protein
VSGGVSLTLTPKQRGREAQNIVVDHRAGAPRSIACSPKRAAYLALLSYRRRCQSQVATGLAEGWINYFSGAPIQSKIFGRNPIARFGMHESKIVWRTGYMCW